MPVRQTATPSSAIASEQATFESCDTVKDVVHAASPANRRASSEDAIADDRATLVIEHPRADPIPERIAAVGMTSRNDKPVQDRRGVHGDHFS